MQICKRTKDRPRAIQHSHQSKNLIMGLHTTHLTNIAKKATNKVPNITRQR